MVGYLRIMKILSNFYWQSKNLEIYYDNFKTIFTNESLFDYSCLHIAKNPAMWLVDRGNVTISKVYKYAKSWRDGGVVIVFQP